MFQKIVKCIDLILNHLERYGPLDEARSMLPQEAPEEIQPQCTFAQTLDDVNEQNSAMVNRQLQGKNANFLAQFCTLMKEQMQRQQNTMLEQMQRQQDMMNQLMMTLILKQGPTLKHPQNAAPISPSREIDGQERFSTATDNAVKFFCNQIPLFGGTEEENVNLWIEKIECISNLHGLSQVVKLSAATSKLSKMAHKWFDEFRNG